jgi:ribose/xylose/arabinose/galactoside ABC-type transport system permease subunit
MRESSERAVVVLFEKYSSVGILIVISAIAGLVSPLFLTEKNLLNVFRATSMLGITSVGMTLVILTGGIDLSVGSVIAISGTFAAFLWKSYNNTALIFVVPLAAGAIIGLLNCLLITELRLPPFIATLASLSAVRGIALVITSGQTIYVDYPESFMLLSQGYLLGLPIAALLFIFITIAASLILRFRPIGRFIYAIGGNEVGSFFSGIDVRKVKAFVYIACALLASFSGLILTARMGICDPGQAGLGFELDAIAAVLIGGTSINGGKGSLVGSFVGAMIIGILNNMFNLLNVAPEIQYVSKGVVIILAVWVQSINLTAILRKKGGKSTSPGQLTTRREVAER